MVLTAEQGRLSASRAGVAAGRVQRGQRGVQARAHRGLRAGGAAGDGVGRQRHRRPCGLRDPTSARETRAGCDARAAEEGRQERRQEERAAAETAVLGHPQRVGRGARVRQGNAGGHHRGTLRRWG